MRPNKAAADGTYLIRDDSGEIVNAKPFDLSFTKNMVTLSMSMLLLFCRVPDDGAVFTGGKKI